MQTIFKDKRSEFADEILFMNESQFTDETLLVEIDHLRIRLCEFFSQLFHKNR